MDVQALVAEVEGYVQQRLSQYIEELRELCAMDSGSYHKSGIDRVTTYLAARLHGLGMDVKIIENDLWGNDIYGELRGDGAGTVLLLGHADTVYPVGIATERPLKIEDNVIYGPGVYDMKGCILSAIYAVEALLAANYRDFGAIRFLCVSDEEISERHSEKLIKQAAKGCHAALVLEGARANGDIVSARKGCAWYKLSARGRSAHAGVEPEKGRNAITEVAHQLLQFESLNGWIEGISINPGTITGGTMPNVVPDYAEARFDMRYLEAADRLAVEKRWREMMLERKVAGVELELALEAEPRHPMERTPGTTLLVRKAQEIAQTLGFTVNHTHTGGSSDASYPAAAGIPTLDGLGPVGGLDHSPYEYLEARSISPRTALLAGLIVTVGRGELTNKLEAKKALQTI